MRLSLKWVLAAGLVVACFWGYRRARGPEYANLPPTGGKAWIAFGDSLTAGTGANPGRDYPAQLAARLGVQIGNFGVPGNTTEDGLVRLPEVLAQRPRVVLLCLGGNDSLRQMPAKATFDNLERIIDQFHQQGAFVILIGVRSASLLDQFESPFRALAKRKRVLYVPDILRGVLLKPDLMSDSLHPNDQGYARIAARLEDALLPLLPKLSE
jgi:lysophospholipase L1-like esterase